MKKQDNFINEELVAVDPFEFSRLSRNAQKGFGVLGNGILRPKERSTEEISKSNTVSSDSLGRFTLLADKDSTAKLADQIAASIQNRIDKAALEQQQAAPEMEESKKKSPALIGGLIIGGILVTGILIYVFKKTKATQLKTA